MTERSIPINGINTVIGFSGSGRALLCLHGWGASHYSFKELEAALQGEKVQIIAPDLPGFGESAEPPIPWSVDDYVNFVEALVQELHLHDVLLLGHSFGGRISIKLAAKQGSCHGERSRTMTAESSLDSARDDTWISHLFLCASAGLRQPRYFRRTLVIKISKMGKAFFSLPVLNVFFGLVRKLLYKILRVHDYERASGVMKDTMVKVINEDLSLYLGKITVPTDLFWGEEDRLTPIRDGYFMNKKIVHSVLHSFAKTTHRVHRDRAGEIAAVIRQRL